MTAMSSRMPVNNKQSNDIAIENYILANYVAIDCNIIPLLSFPKFAKYRRVIILLCLGNLRGKCSR